MLSSYFAWFVEVGEGREGKHGWLRQSLPSPALLPHQDIWAVWHGRITQRKVQVGREKESLRQSVISELTAKQLLGEIANFTFRDGSLPLAWQEVL